MDVATPSADCLTLVYDLLSPVILGNQIRCTLSHQEVSTFLVSVFFRKYVLNYSYMTAM